jgi:antitoxin (DNA-binding transcriptional repressor) of toxin-antitoxin stability system
MRTVDISQAAGSLPEYGLRKPGETWVLTRRGRPVAAVVPLDGEDYFGMRLANDPTFIETIERARARYEATGGVSLAGVRPKHGIEKRRRRAASRKR